MGQSKQAVLTQIYSILTADTTLKSYFDESTVLIYKDWGEINTKTPYINHRIEADNSSYGFVDNGLYIVDIFDISPNTDTIDNIAFRIECLLNQLEFNIPNIAGRVTLFLHLETDVPENEQKHKHYHMEFKVKYFKTAEVIAINSR